MTVEFSGECRLWTRRTMNTGYGELERGGKRYLAHRFAYEEANGPIPDGLVLHHECGNRLCVNPDHLSALTRAEHLAKHPEVGAAIYEARRKRTHCKHGHEYTCENTRVRPDGGRDCRACKRSEFHRRKASA